MNSLLTIGFGFVIGGGLLTAFHLLHLFKNSDGYVPYRIAMALVGGLCISIGANLIAEDIHQRIIN